MEGGRRGGKEERYELKNGREEEEKVRVKGEGREEVREAMQQG